MNFQWGICSSFWRFASTLSLAITWALLVPFTAHSASLWSAPQSLLPVVNASPTAIEISADGRRAVAAWVLDPGNSQVEIRAAVAQINAKGFSWGPSSVVAVSSGQVFGLDLEMSSNLRIALAWTSVKYIGGGVADRTRSTTQVVLGRVNASSSSWGLVNVLDESESSFPGFNVPDVELSSTGDRAIAVWTRPVGYPAAYSVQVANGTSRNSLDVKWSNALTMSSAINSLAEPHVILAADGNFAAAFWSGEQGVQAPVLRYVAGVWTKKGIDWRPQESAPVEGYYYSIAANPSASSFLLSISPTNDKLFVVSASRSGSTLMWGQPSTWQGPGGGRVFKSESKVSKDGTSGVIAWVYGQGNDLYYLMAVGQVGTPVGYWNEQPTPTYASALSLPSIAISGKGSQVVAVWAGIYEGTYAVKSVAASLSTSWTWQTIEDVSSDFAWPFQPSITISDDGKIAGTMWFSQPLEGPRILFSSRMTGTK